MPNLTESDLRDPSPPLPGSKERAAVATRAHQLGRRRRMMQGAGALGMVAVVAVGVAALTAGGTSSGQGGQRIEAASSATDDATDNAVATTMVPDPATTTVPAPASDTTNPASDTTNPATDAPAAVESAAPTAFSVSGTVSNVPAGVTVTLTLTGSGGTFTAIADGSGHYSISGVPAGDYSASYEWVSTDGTATQIGKLGGVSIGSDLDLSFALQ